MRATSGHATCSRSLAPRAWGNRGSIAELLGELGATARLLSGRCLPYGEGITFWPLFEVLDELGEERSERVRTLLQGGASSPEELFLATRRLFESVAREQPLVVVFDDVHWAEPTLLDLIDHISDLSRDAPILLVCLARPDLLDSRPAWGGGKMNATSVLLEPLAGPDTELLLSNLLGETELAEEARARILEAAEGNPLFIEEMLEMLIDDGLLERRNGSWVATRDLTDLDVPPTIHVLLAARLDRLSGEERSVVERAAIEGKLFHRGAVAELSSDRARPQVAAHLLSLVRKELVRPDEPDFADEDAFRFRHLLIRDTAYESLPKAERAELHRLFADWLERKVQSEPHQYEEIVGYHLERAYRYEAELGTIDPDLGRRAAVHLADAGQRANDRRDTPAAVTLLERALSLLPDSDPKRCDFLTWLGSALFEAGDLSRSETLLSEAISRAQNSGDRRGEALARLHYGQVKGQTDPNWRFQDSRAEAAAAAATFEELGDHIGALRAWNWVGLFDFWSNRCTQAEVAYERMVQNARLASNEREASRVPWWTIAAAALGPRPVADAEQRCRTLVDLGQDDPYVEAFGATQLGILAAMRGSFEEARAQRDRGRQLADELGLPLHRAGMAMMFGRVDQLAGDDRAAEAELRLGYDLSRELGDTGYLSTTACYLGEVVYAQGRYDEALRLSEEAEQAGAPDDAITQMKWRALRGLVLVEQGRMQEAESLARESVEVARPGDTLDDIGMCVNALGRVLERAGKGEEARAAFEEALDLWERKGNVVSAARARDSLARLQTQ